MTIRALVGGKGTTSDSKRAVLLAAGADVTIDTTTEDLASVLLAETDGSGALG
ncbi:hypothetical protein [Nocardia anaemiae]|uniref:hypothetical protein n=1 Tax=Nocardia anaemiae TaxID=263910 RepID=UPI000B02568D|nr:hypothetical protein [Nocardia anaemiae]